ncbi:MAG TPA: xanthine dehydrogenase family protein molybdopterin-binding subunit [Acidimicrobiales bacterium]|jgi:carbon-monoxide dehydrogenase large subunit|nr:xanthine dehydrogenase family protein molybdopterin-binding subunit [Acidimicrobiales bacterium]
MGATDIWRVEDDRLLRGAGRFVANLPPRDARHLTFARSTSAHARIAAIDVAAAVRVPGVVAVYTADDLDLPMIVPEPAVVEPRMVRGYLARDVVRFVGEPVVAIVAESLAAAIDAAERVVIEYDPLPVVVEVGDALAGEVVLHPAATTNVALHVAPTGADIVADDGEVIVHLRTGNNRVAIAPLEGRSVLASWDGDSLTMIVSAQGPHPYRERLAPAFGLEPDQVRVVCPDVGGGFGAKGYPYPEEVLTAWAARRTGHAVRFTETRTESMASLGHGRGQLQDVDVVGSRDGTIRALRLRIVQDCGAYPRLGAYLPNMTRLVATGPYRIGHLAYEAWSVVTCTNPVVAYRGAGQPEAAAAVERAIDVFAAEIGLDPVDVRRRNLVTSSEFPYTNAAGLVYDSGDYARGLDTLLAAAGYPELRAEQARRRASAGEPLLGVGVALFIESCSTSNQHEHARVRVDADGSVTAWTGTTPYGQGHATTWAALISDELGMPVARIDVRHGDSSWFPTGTVTGGSRSVQVGGMAIQRAAIAVREAGARVAAQLLEASERDIVYDRARQAFHVAGAPARVIALRDAAAGGDGGCLDRALRFDPAGGTISSGAYLAVVEVDPETGRTDVVRFVAVDDAGVVVHPQIFTGQVHGGVAQGVGQALFEEVVYDADGNLRTANLADYAMPSAAELPMFETIAVETPSPRNALGAKGVGESGPIGAVPAVHNAVVDAVAHLGVRHIDLPLTPLRVWEALQTAAAATPAELRG